MPDRRDYDDKAEIAERAGGARDHTGDMVYGAIITSRGNWMENRGHVELSAGEAQHQAAMITSALRSERSLTAEYESAMHASTLGERIGLSATYHTVAGQDVLVDASRGAVVGGVATVALAVSAAVSERLPGQA